MPQPLVRALGVQKKASALANMELGVLDRQIGEAIVAAAEEVIDGTLAGQLPAGGLADRLRHPVEHERQTK